MPIAVIILGSNATDKKERLIKATEMLVAEAGKITRSSSIYETEPWGFESEEAFYNQVVMLETPYSPERLLDICLHIENRLGRHRIPGVRFASRTIDIDILFYDSKIISSENLIIPHPRIQERNFVLTPLHEILPDFIHPVLGKTIEILLNQSKDGLKVKKSPFDFF